MNVDSTQFAPRQRGNLTQQGLYTPTDVYLEYRRRNLGTAKIFFLEKWKQKEQFTIS